VALRTRQRSNAPKSTVREQERRDREPETGPGDEAEASGANGREATATVTWNGCGRGEFFEGCEQRRGEMPGLSADCTRAGRFGSPRAGNPADLMTGSGMQQARDLRAEETIEVVQNHEDGT
jgi:hypothetical protein